jgi:hypothetical protein
MIDMQHLTLVEGYSYETMIRLLEENRVGYRVSITPGPCGGMFRDSLLHVDEKRKKEVRELLRDCESHISRVAEYRRMIYYGKHQIEHGFDLSSLDGNIRFDRGRLVERVVMVFKKIK